jgi:triosephosphate isomerase (TIM)
MRRPIIAGNWKMNTSLEEATALARSIEQSTQDFESVDRVLIPPFPWILSVCSIVEGSGITVGAQNCYSESSGAFTGEVSPAMLAPHCSHVILGHSERRHILGETDEHIAAKVDAALETDMTVILCVGETLEERERGNAQDVVRNQLLGGLHNVNASDMARVVIAYEPVWAIGTGVAASTADAQEMAAFLRKTITERFNADVGDATRIQYGGSVKADNAPELMASPDIDGALVGGASLKPDEFCAIIEAAEEQVN